MGSHLASNTFAFAGSCLALWLDRLIAAGGLSERGCMFAGSWRGSWVLVLMMRLSWTCLAIVAYRVRQMIN